MTIRLSSDLLYFLTILFGFLFFNMVVVAIVLVRRLGRLPSEPEYSELLERQNSLSLRVVELERENSELRGKLPSEIVSS